MEPTDDDYLIEHLQAQSKSLGPRAKPIRSVMKSLLVQRGINDEQASLELEAAWRRNVDPIIGKETRVGRLQRGHWTIWASNSLVLQELNFSKARLLEALKQELPHLKLRDLRFRAEG